MKSGGSITKLTARKIHRVIFRRVGRKAFDICFSCLRCEEKAAECQPEDSQQTQRRQLETGRHRIPLFEECSAETSGDNNQYWSSVEETLSMDLQN